MRNSHYLIIAALLALTSGWSLAAQAAEAIKVTSVAEVEVVTTGSNGKKIVKRVPPGKAVPGTEVIFTSVFENVSAQAVGDIAIDNPVPAHTLYKGGSATGDNTDIQFSADGGKTFGSPEKIIVKGSDGKSRVALPNEYTHIRWAYKGKLAPGKSGAISFRATIK